MGLGGSLCSLPGGAQYRWFSGGEETGSVAHMTQCRWLTQVVIGGSQVFHVVWCCVRQVGGSKVARIR